MSMCPPKPSMDRATTVPDDPDLAPRYAMSRGRERSGSRCYSGGVA